MDKVIDWSPGCKFGTTLFGYLHPEALYDYSDRIEAANSMRAWEARQESLKVYKDKSPNQIELYLQLYFDDQSIVLTEVLWGGKNSYGCPVYIYGYTKESHV